MDNYRQAALNRLANPAQISADTITRPAWGLWDVVLGLAAFILVPLGGGVLIQLVRGGGGLTPPLVLASLALVWITILAVCLLVSKRRGYGSLARDFGLRFKWIDLAIGFACGVAARLLVLLVLFLILLVWPPEDGQLLESNIGIFLTGDVLWIIVNAFIGGVVIAPLLEELFFRGFILRAVQNAVWLGKAPNGGAAGSGPVRSATVRRPLRLATMTAVLASAALFSIVHLGGVTSLQSTVLLLVSIFVMGIVCGTLTVLTGRLGSAIVTHMVFNGIAIVLALVLQIA
ncbi:MAG TPA: CPBP family intramembrane glutamic endopeptidase [Arthrobacter sp.]|nr:CPBP family intramembrane glutamic endopeptidase [Arthrobacter sp.]